jgi:hypothetical protein
MLADGAFASLVKLFQGEKKEGSKENPAEAGSDIRLVS